MFGTFLGVDIWLAKLPVALSSTEASRLQLVGVAVPSAEGFGSGGGGVKLVRDQMNQHFVWIRMVKLCYIELHWGHKNGVDVGKFLGRL